MKSSSSSLLKLPTPTVANKCLCSSLKNRLIISSLLYLPIGTMHNRFLHLICTSKEGILEQLLLCSE
ncbi:hypothetical protein NC653_029807 [Populus alba x Populus x berolinensis]|uniref:Uncharacterized protein n=1 Tax=Populus alba x Populus x berolinensis TaxID=444605 RepID=A0AAD6Q3X1_9ROSI|nr:hypothetical protein NC653_029807 [Populus alba x Populus x berolinensis]